MSTSRSIEENASAVEPTSIAEQPQNTSSASDGAQSLGKATVPSTAGKRKTVRRATADQNENRNSRLSERRALTDALLRLIKNKVYKLRGLRAELRRSDRRSRWFGRASPATWRQLKRSLIWWKVRCGGHARIGAVIDLR
jgi:IS5 family transposase